MPVWHSSVRNLVLALCLAGVASSASAWQQYKDSYILAEYDCYTEGYVDDLYFYVIDSGINLLDTTGSPYIYIPWDKTLSFTHDSNKFYKYSYADYEVKQDETTITINYLWTSDQGIHDQTYTINKNTLQGINHTILNNPGQYNNYQQWFPMSCIKYSQDPIDTIIAPEPQSSKL